MCSDDKHRQSAPGQRFLSWQFESFKYDGQIWKVLLPGHSSKQLFKPGTCFKNADMRVNNLKIPKRLKREPQFELICTAIMRVWFLKRTLFYFVLASRSSRANTANLRGRNTEASLSRELFDRKSETGTCGSEMQLPEKSLQETRVVMQVGVDSFKQRKKRKRKKD